jgi:hypothetical protein
MLQQINFHIWFKVCKPLKRKYKLSTNCILVLNGMYLYSKYIKQDFTRFAVLKFCSYYNSSKIGKYITVLMTHNFVIESGKYKGHQLYSLSAIGLQVINELNESYKIELSKFCNMYNIVL